MNDKNNKEIEDHANMHVRFNELLPYEYSCKYCLRRFKNNVTRSAHIRTHSEQNGKFSFNAIITMNSYNRTYFKDFLVCYYFVPVFVC